MINIIKFFFSDKQDVQTKQKLPTNEYDPQNKLRKLTMAWRLRSSFGYKPTKITKNQAQYLVIYQVLTVAAMLNVSYPKQYQFNHKIIHAFDLPTYKMTPHFDNAIQFIKNGLKSGNVLVHCAAGISRVKSYIKQSTTCVLAYLMKTKGLTYKQSLEITRKKRPIVNPNYGFEDQLKRFQLQLINTKSTKQQTKIHKLDQFLSKQEKNAVINFIKQQIKQKKLNSTFSGNKNLKVNLKTENISTTARGISQKHRKTFHHQIKYNKNLYNQLLATKIQTPPKVVSYKK